jgi:hypothetical protein
VFFRITAFIATCYNLFRGNDEVLKFWNKKGKAVKKWRSRAWSIDPHETNLTIVAKKDKFSQHVPPWMHKKCRSFIAAS